MLSNVFVDNDINHPEIAGQLTGYDRGAVKAAFFEAVAPVCHSNLQAPIPPYGRHSTAPSLPISSTAACGLAGLLGLTACATRFCSPTCVFDFVMSDSHRAKVGRARFQESRLRGAGVGLKWPGRVALARSASSRPEAFIE
ncbi:DUF7079 family protein [Stutzerimonas kunmingensis]|uniref:DUF7079 family protein n=1 Tax=Stutzerimonas kunmingensis TaxID=1211807 RepID=UPI00406BF97D